MAKRKGKKSKGRKGRSTKRSRAAKRAYRKSALYKLNQRRKKAAKRGGKKRGGKRKASRKSYGKKKRGGRKGRKAKARAYANRYSGTAVAARARFAMLVKRLEAKGHDHKTAVALAQRASRIHTAMKRGVEKEKAAKHAQQQALSNLFSGIGAAGQLSAMAK